MWLINWYLCWMYERQDRRRVLIERREALREGLEFLRTHPEETQWHEYGIGWEQHLYRPEGRPYIEVYPPAALFE